MVLCFAADCKHTNEGQTVGFSDFQMQKPKKVPTKFGQVWAGKLTNSITQYDIAEMCATIWPLNSILPTFLILKVQNISRQTIINLKLSAHYS